MYLSYMSSSVLVFDYLRMRPLYLSLSLVRRTGRFDAFHAMRHLPRPIQPAPVKTFSRPVRRKIHIKIRLISL